MERVRAMPHEQVVQITVELTNLQGPERIVDSGQTMLIGFSGVVIFYGLTFWLGFLIRLHAGFSAILMMVWGLLAVLFTRLLIQYQGDWVFPLLGEYHDVRLIAPALTSWKYAPAAARPYLEACLICDLPLLTPEAALELTSPQRTVLRKLLLHPQPHFCLAVLRTLSRLQDTEAISTLETLLTRRVEGGVQAFAETCLAQLRAIKAAEVEGKILLRASGNAADEETLLRAVKTEKPMDERHLLRPRD